MPVNTNVQNSKAILDAIADFLDKTVDGPKALSIVEEFVNQVGGPADNESKGADFLQTLFDIIRKSGRSHVGTAARAANEAAVQAAMDAADSNL